MVVVNCSKPIFKSTKVIKQMLFRDIWLLPFLSEKKEPAFGILQAFLQALLERTNKRKLPLNSITYCVIIDSMKFEEHLKVYNQSPYLSSFIFYLNSKYILANFK